MRITKLNAFSDNYIWMIFHPEENRCICVDPGDANPVFRFLKAEALKLDAIFLTHHHFDHQGGVDALVSAYPDIKVFGPADKRMPLVTEQVSENSEFEHYDYTFKVWEIPGHTSSHIAYYEPQQECLFCGDTLFSAGCGRVFDGTIEALFQSLERLGALPASTKVFCAHEYTLNNLKFAQKVEPANTDIQNAITAIEKNPNQCTLPSEMRKEKKINPFFRLNEPGVIAYTGQYGSAFAAMEVFKILRQNKDNF